MRLLKNEESGRMYDGRISREDVKSRKKGKTHLILVERGCVPENSDGHT
jgi:hypothetical protein